MVSGFTEIGVVVAIITGLTLTTFTNCGCYGLPLPWRYLLVVPGGGGGFLYSWTSFVMDIVFFLAIGVVLAFSGTAFDTGPQ